MRRGRAATVTGMLALLLAGVSPAPAQAQRANYNDVIIGSRAAAMGGAFTGVADDTSAVFHNPAGIAQIRRDGISLSVNGYAYQRTDIDGVLEARGESASLTLDSIFTFPTISGLVKPLGEGDGWSHSVALSLVVPQFFEYEGVDHLEVPGEPIAVDVFADVKERVYLAGPSYGFRYGNLYLGASLFVQYVTLDVKRSLDVNAVTVDRSTAIHSSRFELTRASFFGLTGNLGALVKPTEELALGATFWLPNTRLAGTGETFASLTRTEVTLDGTGDVAHFQDVYRNVEGDTNYEVAPALQLGAALALPGLTLALDVDLHFALGAYDFVDASVEDAPPDDDGDVGDLSEHRSYDPAIRDPGRDLVVNPSLGAEVSLAETWSLLLGAFTDFSSVPNQGARQLDQLDMYGASLGVRHLGESSDLTVGLSGRYGTGTTFDADVVDTSTRFAGEGDATRWSLTVFVGGNASTAEDGGGGPDIPIP